MRDPDLAWLRGGWRQPFSQRGRRRRRASASRPACRRSPAPTPARPVARARTAACPTPARTWPRSPRGCRRVLGRAGTDLAVHDLPPLGLGRQHDVVELVLVAVGGVVARLDLDLGDEGDARRDRRSRAGCAWPCVASLMSSGSSPSALSIMARSVLLVIFAPIETPLSSSLPPGRWSGSARTCAGRAGPRRR